jgi:hypothetical protein
MRAMFTFADMVHFFAHNFSGLSRCGFALPPVTPGSFESLFFWHNVVVICGLFLTTPLHYRRITKLGPMGFNP